LSEQIRVCIDLDGTICEIKKPEDSYLEVPIKKGAREKMQALKEAGFYLIIHTARGMGTAKANEGAMMKRIGKDTFDWLAKHEIPYDEIYFGKPNAHVCIDDRAIRFTSWDDITAAGITAVAKER